MKQSSLPCVLTVQGESLPTTEKAIQRFDVAYGAESGTGLLFGQIELGENFGNPKLIEPGK